ncbi:hypothetical protein AB205_0196050 [Aquarana catesbeiana]|uniref:Uncharacterized protein n=1 Tax=Aquarana catesbeiana TaxID=8400 RepID=A0A2G9RPW1_AQUCT|nr:hypothetical protein AB205_0196050 [Aquarana catesbeiana]
MSYAKEEYEKCFNHFPYGLGNKRHYMGFPVEMIQHSYLITSTGHRHSWAFWCKPEAWDHCNLFIRLPAEESQGTSYDPYNYQADYDAHTGDPKQDLAYERQYEQQTYQVIPEVIKNFIQYFHKTVSDLIDQKVYELQASRVSSDVIDQKVYEIQDIYENRRRGPGS